MNNVFISLMFICAFKYNLDGCSYEQNSIIKNKFQTSYSKSQSIRIGIDSLRSNDYSLFIQTRFIKDTLNVVDYKEDIYSSPVIVNQKLIFYCHNKILKKYKLPLRSIRKQSIKKKAINALQTPIYQARVTEAKNGTRYYVLLGSGYCNGYNCPEFIGIYSMNGEIIYEGLSTLKNNKLAPILSRNKIQLNKWLISIKVSNFPNWRDAKDDAVELH